MKIGETQLDAFKRELAGKLIELYQNCPFYTV